MQRQGYFASSSRHIDFVSIYSDAVGVTTGSTKNAPMLPDIPTAYKQAFEGLHPDELYIRHLEANQIVQRRESVSLPAAKGDLLAQIESAMIRQAQYVMSLPLWKFRGVFWFFLRRNLLVNKPISERP